MSDHPFLRVPPFPGAAHTRLADGDGMHASPGSAMVEAALAAVRAARVGGEYWGARPSLPDDGYVLIFTAGLSRADIDAVDTPALLCGEAMAVNDEVVGHVPSDCDPWHVIERASRVIAAADNENLLIAGLLGKPLQAIGTGRFARIAEEGGLHRLFAEHVLAPFAWRDCFTGRSIDFVAAVALAAFWRDVIDSNRDIGTALGFAFWKRPTVTALLWNGSAPVAFADRAPSTAEPGKRVAIWRSRADVRELARLDRSGFPMAEVEDGFIRSVGLGADCVPPLSIVVDRLGVHFDPTRPSELEKLLVAGDFSADMLDRAARLREVIVASGISKYDVAQGRAARRGGERRHILVPGQVEDDRSVQSGGGSVKTNLELLRRARADAPDAYILYKPHPDVEAGHRVGAIPDDVALRLADEVVRDEGIGTLMAMVDELHVNTSLAGFEALLRHRKVTTHGVPFYAGWGLTRDLGDVPVRRGVERTLDELVAAVLLIYPRYLDPVTGLPCPPEILIDRLTRQLVPEDGWLVRLRRWQGRARRLLGNLRQGRSA